MKQSMTLMNKNTPVMEFTGELKYYTKEDFDVVAKSLEKEGYTIAYQFDNAGIVLKEVDALESENSES